MSKRITKQLKEKGDLRNIVSVRPGKVHRCKIFSVRQLISNNFEVYRCRGELVDFPGDHLDEGLGIAKKIFKIEGVQSVSTAQYDIMVLCGYAFDWVELEDLVVSKIREYLKMKSDANDQLEKLGFDDGKK